MKRLISGLGKEKTNYNPTKTRSNGSMKRKKYEENKRKEQALDETFQEEAKIRCWMRQEKQEAEINKIVCEEKFALELEKLEIAEKKRVKPKLPDLQISKF